MTNNTKKGKEERPSQQLNQRAASLAPAAAAADPVAGGTSYAATGCGPQAMDPRLGSTSISKKSVAMSMSFC